MANTKRGLEAIPHLNKLVKIDSTHTAAYQLLYKIYIAKNDREEALEQIKRLKRIEPYNYEHYTEEAYFHMAKNHIFLANENFEKAIQLGDPEPITCWDNARCLYQMKFYHEAIVFFSMMEDQNTRFNDFTMLADCYQKTNRPQPAIDYYNKALVLAIPSAFELSNIFSGKAHLYIQQGKYDEAIANYQEALGHYQGISSGAAAKNMTVRAMADIYQTQLNHPEKAIELYQKLLNEVSEYSNPHETNYYKQEITRLNEEVFFKGN
jgi:tetratricopeptide (TPR) repeat protein